MWSSILILRISKASHKQVLDKHLPLAPNTWLSWLGVGFISLLWRLPRAVRNTIAQSLAKYSVGRHSATNRAININLQACFPKLDDAARQAVFERYAALHIQALMLSPRNWWGSDKTVVEKSRLHNQHFLDEALASGQPVVLLVTHSAGLDAGLLALSPHYPLQGIYNPLDNPVLDYLVYRARHRFNAKPLPRGSGFRQLIKGLHSGKIMCYLSDEDLGPDGAVFAPFFGHQKATLAMLPRIAKKTNALVVPMIAHHNSDDDAIDVHLFEPLQNYPSVDAIADARVMNEAIAETIRLQPAQFTWKLRVFKTCPEGKGTRYGQIERGEIGVGDL